MSFSTSLTQQLNDVVVYATTPKALTPAGQPWQAFIMPKQINSNAPDVLMQQARDTNENYMNYLQSVTQKNINDTILFAAAGLALVFLLTD